MIFFFKKYVMEISCSCVKHVFFKYSVGNTLHEEFCSHMCQARCIWVKFLWQTLTALIIQPIYLMVTQVFWGRRFLYFLEIFLVSSRYLFYVTCWKKIVLVISLTTLFIQLIYLMVMQLFWGSLRKDVSGNIFWKLGICISCHRLRKKSICPNSDSTYHLSHLSGGYVGILG